MHFMPKKGRFLRRELFYRSAPSVLFFFSNRKKIHGMEEQGEKRTICNRYYAGFGCAGAS